MAWISPLEELKLGKRRKGMKEEGGTGDALRYSQPFEGWDMSR